jgi:hypothetical protein
MAHDFNIVAIEIDNEGAVVVGMIDLPDPRWPIVFPSGL